MPNRVFNTLLEEKISIFKASFSTNSQKLFYDPNLNRLTHAGEFGIYREAIVKEFIKFITPRNLEISSGFLINDQDDVSTQCDVVLFDSKLTPLYQDNEMQRFFPVESVYCIAEVKSKLSLSDFKSALNKLAKNKILGSKMKNPSFISANTGAKFDPIDHPYHLFSSVLICQKLDFDIGDIENQIDSYYDPGIASAFKHNMILSIEDRLLSYIELNRVSVPYPKLRGVDNKNTVALSLNNSDAHIKIFASYLFMLATSKQLFYPEVTNYFHINNQYTSRNQR